MSEGDALWLWRHRQVGLQSDLELSAQKTEASLVPPPCPARPGTTSRRVRRQWEMRRGNSRRRGRGGGGGGEAGRLRGSLHSTSPPPPPPATAGPLPVFPGPAPATVHEGNSGGWLAGRPWTGRQAGPASVTRLGRTKNGSVFIAAKFGAHHSLPSLQSQH